MVLMPIKNPQPKKISKQALTPVYINDLANRSLRGLANQDHITLDS